MKLFCRLTHENRVVKIDTNSVVTISDDLAAATEYDGEKYIPLQALYCEPDGTVQIVKDICDIEVY